ncbi:MAG TPA: glycosyltransferase family 4 protein [Steroidobacteraceae bacterium]
MPRMLLISADDFSGVVPALTAALRRAGCDVVWRRQTLRELGLRRYWHAIRMTIAARWLYGRDASRLIDRTGAAFAARSRVNARLIERHPGIDAVILFNTNSICPSAPGRPRPQLILYTDYVNRLSKSLPHHGFDLLERRTHADWNALEGEALLIQDRVLVMGQHVKPAMEALYGVRPDKVAAIGAGPGLDVDIERDGGCKDPSNRTILFVGKLGPVKGLDVLLQAFAKVRHVHADAVLHVVTGAEVAAPGVVVHRRVEERELKELFYSANVFVMPAFKEPLGLVFLEAMWSKCACIGTTTGSMPEMIQDGVTGYLIEPGDVAALAGRLEALLADPAETRSMGERGYVAAKGYWSWDGVVQRMLAQYRLRPTGDQAETRV